MPFDPNKPYEVVSEDQSSEPTPAAPASIEEAAKVHAPDMAKYYSGTSNLGSVFNDEQKLAFSKLTAYTPNDNESQLRAINQAFVKTQMPDMPTRVIDNNWEAVKKGYAETRFGLAKDNINDTEFYTNVGQTYDEIDALKHFSTTPKPWDWKAKVAAIETLAPYAVKNFWNNFTTPIKTLPAAPHDLPNKFYTVPGTTIIVNPAVYAGIWNGMKPALDSMLSPAGIVGLVATEPVMAGLGALAETSALAKTALVSIKGGFGLIAAKAGLDSGSKFNQLLKDPKASLEDKIAAGTETFIDGALALVSGFDAALDFFPKEKQVSVVKEIQESPEKVTDILKREEAATDIPGHAEAIKDVRTQIEEVQNVLPTEPPKLSDATLEELKVEPAPVEPVIAETTQEAVAREAEREPTILGPEPTTIIEEPKADGAISIKNEVMDREMEFLGLDPALPGEKKSFEGVVNDINKKYKDDPAIGTRLVNELTANPRAPTAEENVILGFEATRLKNARNAAEDALLKARSEGNVEAEAAAQQQIDILRDQFSKTAATDKLVGTASGQSLAFRKVMLREDYSLAALERKLEVAKGEKLTPQETENLRDISKRLQEKKTALTTAETRQRAQVKRYATLGEKLKAKMEAGDTTRQQRKEAEMTPELFKAKTEYEKIKREFDRKIYEAEQANRTLPEKARNIAIRINKAGVLSRVGIITKLTALVAERSIVTPIRQALKYGYSKAFPEAAEAARFEGIESFGGLVRSEAKALAALWTEGLPGALDILTGKQPKIEQVLGVQDLPKDVLDFPAQLHKALHFPIQISDYVRRLALINERDIRAGIDMNEPMNQLRNMNEAFEYSKRSIYVQDSKLVNGYKAMLRTISSEDKAGGFSPIGKTLAFGLELQNPVMTVTLNVAEETFSHIFGLLDPATRFLVKGVGGFKNLKQAEADMLMRNLANGSIGAFLALLGWLKYKEVGGFYTDDKRKPGDLKPGEIKVNGTVIPSNLLKENAFEVMNAGASYRKAFNATYKKSTSITEGAVDGFFAVVAGLADGTPYAGDIKNLSRLLDPTQRDKAIAQSIANTLVPGFVQEAAAATDRPEPLNIFQAPTQRKATAKTLGGALKQELQLRIPGQRFRVPKAGSKDLKTFAR